jgi:hypothetical protein
MVSTILIEHGKFVCDNWNHWEVIEHFLEFYRIAFLVDIIG